jgi:DNA segregation ATPase FtsK/SpoIIIE-like protein
MIGPAGFMAGPQKTAEDKHPFGGANDPLYLDAVAIVRKHRRGSISLVQRHLRIGYNRAAYMLEAMVGTVLAEMAPTAKLLPEDTPNALAQGRPE